MKIPVILIILNAALCAQDSFIDFNPYDSALKRVDYTFTNVVDELFMYDSLIYFSSAYRVERFAKEKNIPVPAELDTVDFSENSFVLIAYKGVDCHSGFIIRLFDESKQSRYVFDVAVMYGGCRAGGRNFMRWAIIPKLPKGYTLEFHKHVIYEKDPDDWDSYK